LSSYIPVWPPVNELIHASHKLDLINDLDVIARVCTKTPRPTTRPLRSPSDVGTNNVTKREGSDCGNTVSLPRSLTASDIKRMLKHKSEFLWFVQSYIPEYRTVGEIRVYVVGNQIRGALLTIPGNMGDWEVAWIRNHQTLQQMK
jgi:glutathione synthase/RimK-type ligase-like ATP-grasp enzyme